MSGVDFGAILTNAARFSADPEALAKWPQDEANKRSLVGYGFRILVVCSLDCGIGIWMGSNLVPLIPVYN